MSKLLTGLMEAERKRRALTEGVKAAAAEVTVAERAAGETARNRAAAEESGRIAAEARQAQATEQVVAARTR